MFTYLFIYMLHKSVEQAAQLWTSSTPSVLAITVQTSSCSLEYAQALSNIFIPFPKMKIIVFWKVHEKIL